MSGLMVDGGLTHLLAAYGYWAVGAFVGLESTGVPLPGETMLIGAAIYAGQTGRLGIVGVVTAAAIGAVAGDNIGFWAGRSLGQRWLVRHGRAIRLTPRRVKLGRFLFHRHGGKVVFFGRFVAVLRALAAFLAGTNCMSWRRFLAFNVAGGVTWAAAYGFGAYGFGRSLAQAAGRLDVVLLAAAGGLVVAGLVYFRRHERRLEDEAERALPGPLDAPGSGT